MRNTNCNVSVIMPTFNQGAYILNSINSLFKQTHKNWELIIINDGSSDNTEEIINSILPHPQIKYLKNIRNKGLGKCLNIGIKASSYELISYLPSDDIYYQNHLEILLNNFNSFDNVVLSYSGVQYDYKYRIDNNDWPVSKKLNAKWLQLVQVLHKKADQFWMERSEMVTDDLFIMYWEKLLHLGIFTSTNKITCQQTNHPKQRHKIIDKKFEGGLATYRAYYSVKEPIKFHSNSGDFFDEREYYSSFKKKYNSKNGLKILLVGELSYNPERIYALEQLGHKLFGLWINNPIFMNNVGPLPFGNVKDISYSNWKQTINKIKPDIIYATQNDASIVLAHEVLMSNTGIPFVWHYKEGFSMARDHGLWEKLIDLYTYSDGQIYINELMRCWFERFLPAFNRNSLIIDGDLPKKEWFTNEKKDKLSLKDGEVHTIILGRPICMTNDFIGKLMSEKIHVHIFGNYNELYRDWIERNKKFSQKYFHVHSNVFPNNWVKEFSKYDAGWLHNFESSNCGDLHKVTWHDLNLPARMSTLAAAGLPMIMKNNKGHLVASQQVLENLGIGILYTDFTELNGIIHDKDIMKTLSENIWINRFKFSFDYYIPELIKFFEDIISKKKTNIYN